MKKLTLRVLAGIDLGWWTHVVCALDSKGNFLKEASFSHDTASLTEIANWLLELAKGDPNRIAVATEKPHGAVVDSLLTRSIAVYAINPKQVDRFRDRHSVAGAKDDRRDAFVLAEALRTDGHRFHRVQLPTPEVLALREQLRMDEDLRQEEIALANRLRDHLMRVQPHLLKLAPANLVDPFFWDILEQFGTPQKAKHAQLQILQALPLSHSPFTACAAKCARGPLSASELSPACTARGSSFPCARYPSRWSVGTVSFGATSSLRSRM